MCVYTFVKPPGGPQFIYVDSFLICRPASLIYILLGVSNIEHRQERVRDFSAQHHNALLQKLRTTDRMDIYYVDNHKLLIAVHFFYRIVHCGYT